MNKNSFFTCLGYKGEDCDIAITSPIAPITTEVKTPSVPTTIAQKSNPIHNETTKNQRSTNYDQITTSLKGLQTTLPSTKENTPSKTQQPITSLTSTIPTTNRSKLSNYTHVAMSSSGSTNPIKGTTTHSLKSSSKDTPSSYSASITPTNKQLSASASRQGDLRNKVSIYQK